MNETLLVNSTQLNFRLKEIVLTYKTTPKHQSYTKFQIWKL